MASGFGSIGSVLTERPPSDGPWATPVPRDPATGHSPAAHRPPPAYVAQPTPASLLGAGPASISNRGSASKGNHSSTASGNRAWYDSLLSGRQYDVVYDDADGYPLLAFADGQWYDVTSFTPQPVTVRYAMRLDPAWAGAIVQTVCMWMRTSPHHDRSFELATELALAVGELARQASS